MAHIVVFGIGLHRLLCVCLCLKFPVTSIYDLPGVVNCLFHTFAGLCDCLHTLFMQNIFILTCTELRGHWRLFV